MKVEYKDESAFPVESGMSGKINGGLTKREYFAAVAMQGILTGASGIADPKHWVTWSVKYADALLAELSKESP